MLSLTLNVAKIAFDSRIGSLSVGTAGWRYLFITTRRDVTVARIPRLYVIITVCKGCTYTSESATMDS